MKIKRTHLNEVREVEINTRLDGFELIFYDCKKGEFHLHLQYWWLRYIAKTLWKQIHYHQERIAEMIKAMKAE